MRGSCARSVVVMCGVLVPTEGAWGNLASDTLVCARPPSVRSADYVTACDRALRAPAQRTPKLTAFLLLKRALHRRQLNLYRAALADLDRAARFRPRDKRIYFTRASIYRILDRNDAAMREYRTVLRLDPSDGEARAALLELRHAPAAGGSAAATRLCRRHPATNDTVVACTRLIRSGRLQGRALAQVLNRRGQVYMELRNYTAAIGDFGMAIRLDPQGERHYHGRGAAFHALKRCRHAIADYTKALSLDPRAADTYAARAGCYEMIGLLRAALRDYRRARQLDPGNRDLFRHIRRLERKI